MAHLLTIHVTKYPPKSQISLGTAVSIETKENQGKGILSDGIVRNVLTSVENHPHGIKVRLEDGRVGRVKMIISTDNISAMQE